MVEEDAPHFSVGLEDGSQESSRASSNIHNQLRLREVICFNDALSLHFRRGPHVLIEYRRRRMVLPQVFEQALSIDIVEGNLTCLHGVQQLCPRRPPPRLPGCRDPVPCWRCVAKGLSRNRPSWSSEKTPKLASARSIRRRDSGCAHTAAAMSSIIMGPAARMSAT